MKLLWRTVVRRSNPIRWNVNLPTKRANNAMTMPAIKSEEHWTSKAGDARLFLFEKFAGDPAASKGTVLFVHGSSVASQPPFALQVPGGPGVSAADTLTT